MHVSRSLAFNLEALHKIFICDLHKETSTQLLVTNVIEDR